MSRAPDTSGNYSAGTEGTSEALALMNRFTHRHINFVGACKVNHMCSPVTLQEFVSRMHDKWMETYCWFTFRQLTTCDDQKPSDTLNSFNVTWCLKHCLHIVLFLCVKFRCFFFLFYRSRLFSPLFALCVFLTSWHIQRAMSKRQSFKIKI